MPNHGEDMVSRKPPGAGHAGLRRVAEAGGCQEKTIPGCLLLGRENFWVLSAYLFTS